MKVKELINLLREEDPEAIVIMAKDSEGNSYSPLSDFWCGVYQAETSWSGEVGYSELTEDLENAGYTEEDLIEGGASAVILCPIN